MNPKHEASGELSTGPLPTEQIAGGEDCLTPPDATAPNPTPFDELLRALQGLWNDTTI